MLKSLAAIAVVLTASVLACSSSLGEPTASEPTAREPAMTPPNPAGGPDASTSPVNVSRAQLLITQPTTADVAQAVRDHVPTGHEQLLAAVYWGFLIKSMTEGEVDTEVLSALQPAVIAIAKNYPTFFTQDAQGGISLAFRGITSPKDFACGGSCRPSAKLLFSSALEVADAVRSVTGAPGLVAEFTGISQGVLNAVKAGSSLNDALTHLDSGKTLKALIELGSFFGAANAELVVGAAEATAIAEVGAVWAAFSAGYAVGEVLNLVYECTTFKGEHCCGSQAACATTTTQACSGTKVVALGSVCLSGACANTETPIKECAPERCENGVCVANCGPGQAPCTQADQACINGRCTQCGIPGDVACPTTGCSLYPDYAVEQAGICLSAGTFGQVCLANGTCRGIVNPNDFQVFCDNVGLCEYGGRPGSHCYGGGTCINGSCSGSYCLINPVPRGGCSVINPNGECCGYVGYPACAGATSFGNPYPDGCFEARNTPVGGFCVECGTGTTCCPGSAACDASGIERSTGSGGEPCKADGTCSQTGVECASGVCMYCGGRGEQCCAAGQACHTAGAVCVAGYCLL